MNHKSILDVIRRILLVTCYVVIIPVSWFVLFYAMFFWDGKPKNYIEYLEFFSAISIPIFIILAIYGNKKSFAYLIIPLILIFALSMPILRYTGRVQTISGLETNIKYCEERVASYEKTIAEGKKWNDIPVDSCRQTLISDRQLLEKYK